MYEVKYVWMNEADSVFAKKGSRIEVPYFEPSFLGSLDVKSMIPRSHGIWMNDIKEFMCYMQNVLYAIWYVLFVNAVWKCEKFDDVF